MCGGGVGVVVVVVVVKNNMMGVCGGKKNVGVVQNLHQSAHLSKHTAQQSRNVLKQSLPAFWSRVYH